MLRNHNCGIKTVKISLLKTVISTVIGKSYFRTNSRKNKSQVVEFFEQYKRSNGQLVFLLCVTQTFGESQ
jgi:hypothetical protein